MKKTLLQIGMLSAMLLLAIATCSAQTGAETDYTVNCVTCHGQTGAGDTSLGRVLKVKPFTDFAVLQMTDSAISDIVANGKNRMPGFSKKLTNDQVNALIQYIHQLQGK
jgi:mono/diheme cytochrome c family protein